MVDVAQDQPRRIDNHVKVYDTSDHWYNTGGSDIPSERLTPSELEKLDHDVMHVDDLEEWKPVLGELPSSRPALYKHQDPSLGRRKRPYPHNKSDGRTNRSRKQKCDEPNPGRLEEAEQMITQLRKKIKKLRDEIKQLRGNSTGPCSSGAREEQGAVESVEWQCGGLDEMECLRLHLARWGNES